MLFTLIKNELIKITRRSKTWIVFAMFSLLVIGTVCLCHYEAERTKRYKSPESQIENIQNEIQSNNNYISKNENSTEERTKEEVLVRKNEVQNLNKELEKQQELLKHKDEPDFWKISLKEEKERIQRDIDEGTMDNQIIEHYKERIKEIDKALDEDKRPIESWEFNSINFSISFMDFIGLVILAAGIAVFMSDIVSGESTPPTLKFLLVQPVKRSKIILSKFIAVVITVISMIGGLEILSFGALSIVSGFEGWDMKEVIGTKYEWDYSTVATQGEPVLKAIENSGVETTRLNLLLQGFGLQILFIIACCAFIFLISAVFKTSMTTMAISVIVSVASTMAALISKTVGKISHLNFFNYGDPIKVLDGKIIHNFSDPNLTVEYGICVMCITILVSYIIAHIVFNKKDILI
ncbi:MAG: ABC transporter permease [Clostridium sp.]|nr:ABC transporter permease [Clostridium sp.]